MTEIAELFSGVETDRLAHRLGFQQEGMRHEYFKLNNIFFEHIF